jgi:hypothetical protein
MMLIIVLDVFVFVFVFVRAWIGHDCFWKVDDGNVM